MGKILHLLDVDGTHTMCGEFIRDLSPDHFPTLGEFLEKSTLECDICQENNRMARITKDDGILEDIWKMS